MIFKVTWPGERHSPIATTPTHIGKLPSYQVTKNSQVTKLPSYPRGERIQMINCNHPNCKKHKTCNLKEPTTPLTSEINYWLNELTQAKRRVKQYETVLEEIENHKHSTIINVYGHIEYAPKTNIFGVFIRRPEHIYYGWNLNKLEKNVKDLTEKVRRLRLKELELIRNGV